MEFTVDISKYIDQVVEFALKHPLCSVGAAVFVIFLVATPIIGLNWLNFLRKLKRSDGKSEKSAAEPLVVTEQLVPQPSVEPPAESQKPVKLLTKPPVDIAKPLYREQLVAELCQEITAAAQAGEDNKFLLSGFGGVGKTTVARALYRKLKNQCKQIGWVECRESGNLKAGLLAAIYTSDENKTAEDRFAEIEGILREATGQTILFLDNVDQPDELLTELTRYDVTLVVTSRLSEAAGYLSKPIPPLSEDECVELFRSYCARTVTDEDEPVVRELVRLVSCHTLSVELLAKGVPWGMDLSAYRDRLQAEGFGFPGLEFSTGHDRESRTVVEHLKKLFDMAKLDEEQTRVMQNLALMADSRTLPAEVQDWIGCDENTLADLVRTGWLTMTEAGYEVHPIVREIVLLDEVPVAKVEKFLRFVTFETYFQDGEDYRTVQLKLGIVEAVLEKVVDRLEENRNTAALDTILGNICAAQGELGNAEEYHQKALNIAIDALGTDDLATASSYNNLGNTYGKYGKYNQAEECHRNALDIKLRVLGEEHSDTASSYNNLGNVFFLQGNYVQAQKCHRKALDIKLKVLGEEHSDTASSYNNLGVVCEAQGKYDQAENYYKKALKIQRKARREAHSFTASIYNNLGTIYCSQGKYAQAEKCYKKALDINLKVSGPNHPDTAGDYNNLGTVYGRQKKYGKALEQCLNAWKIYQKILNSEHPYTKGSKKNLRRIFPHTHYKGIRRIIYTFFPHAKRIDQDFDTWLSQQ